jgi:type II secretory pathway pseudopilin PulG
LGRPAKGKASSRDGFSILELVVTLAVIMILTAIATPQLSRAYEAYLFNSSASQVAGILKLTRFEAIRKNKQVSCQIQQVPNSQDWLLWADPTNNPANAASPTEPQYRMTGTVSLLPAGAPPPPTAITAALNTGGLTTISGVNAPVAVAFDPRGAVTIGGGQPPVYVLYIGNAARPDWGYRAVVLLPSGAVHVWTAGSIGAWQQIS